MLPAAAVDWVRRHHLFPGAGTTGTGRSSCGLEQEEDTSITREQYGGVHARLEGWDGCEVGAGCVRDRKQAKLHHG